MRHSVHKQLGKTSVRKCAGVLLLTCAFLAVSQSLMAQERHGNIEGATTDRSGAFIPSVKVTIVNKETSRTLTTLTRGDGTYTVADVEPGRYTVSFEKTGFRRQETPDVLVLVGKTAKVDGLLEVGSTSETVEVSGTTALIDTASTTIAQNVTSEELDRIPKARTFQAVAVLSPAVTTGYVDAGIQINGASAAENQYYIDGVPTTSIIDGSARQSATFDYVQEVQVKTTGLDAEYGGALGGVVSAVTRSGGNNYHGDLHYYYYGNKLSTDPTKRMTIDNISSTGWKYFQDRKNQNDSQEIGGSLGGPIFKDKLWFYTALSPQWQSRENQYNFFNSDTQGYTDPGTMNRRFHKDNWFNKLSWDPTSRIRTNLTWLYTPESMTGALYSYDGFAPNTSNRSRDGARSERGRGYAQAENSLTGQVDFTLTNSSILSVRGGRYYLNYKDFGVDPTKQLWWQSSSACVNPGDFGCSIPAELRHPQNFVTPSAAITAHDLTTRTYIQADVNQLLRFGGQHSIKFGIGTQKNINNVDDKLAPLGRVNLFWNRSCGVCSSDPAARGTYGYYSIDGRGTFGTTGSYINHIYIQDSWKVMNRLVINAGVRFEKETIPSFRTDVKSYALQFGYGDKIAPRLGASYDLFGNGKVKLSGGWGRYFDWVKFELARGTFGGDYWRIYYRSLDTNDPNVINKLLQVAVVPGSGTPAASELASAAALPGRDLWLQYKGGLYRDRRIPGFDTIDPAVKAPATDSYSAGVEWEIMPKMVFTGRYVANHLVRTIEDMGSLDAQGNEVYTYGNPGFGTNIASPATGASCPITVGTTCAVPMPKAVRNYDAMELSLGRRFSGGFLFNASYTLSRLDGNYAGTQSTDEISPATLGTGSTGRQAYGTQYYRPGGNANRYFDLDEILYDSHGHLLQHGPLPTDRPHVFKFYGAKEFRFGTEVGGFFVLQSGTPVSTLVNDIQQITLLVNGRGDLGRTPMFSQTDIMVAHEFKVGKDEGKRVRLEMNVANLFNQKTGVYKFDRYNRQENSSSTGPNLSKVDLTKGYDYKALVAAGTTNPTDQGDLDPRFQNFSDFNPGLTARFMVKFIF